MAPLTITRQRRGITLVRRIYLARVIVLLLGFVSVGSVLYQLHVRLQLWGLAVFQCFVWPHVAYWIEARAPKPGRVARRTLLVDNLLVGFWMPVIHFNLLPCATVASMTSMSNAGVGGPRLLLRGAVAHAVGAAVGMLLVGFYWEPLSSFQNVLATIPLLVLYPVALGTLTYQLAMRLSQERNKLDHLSKHDGLSGLFNRMHWESLVADEFARGLRQRTPAAIILADIDYFKAINDRDGHAAGDAVIRQFADLLRANVREIDRAARYGGEEFAVLLPTTTLPEAIDAAERLRSILEFHPLASMRVTASFGVAELSADLSDFSDWVRRADTALYRAKAEGRNRVVACAAQEQLPGAQR